MAGKNGTGKAAALANFRPQRVNANRHNARGVGMLTRAMQRSGYVAPMTAAADGEVIDGSARLEVAADVFDGAEPIVVDHDGTRPIIMRRTDIPNATDPRAVEISLAANRIAQVDLEWDADVLAAIAEAGEVDLSGLWDEAELDAFHLGVPSLEDLEDKYGEWDERDGWPVIRVQVSPETKETFDSFMGRAPGADDGVRFAAVLAAVDVGQIVG